MGASLMSLLLACWHCSSSSVWASCVAGLEYNMMTSGCWGWSVGLHSREYNHRAFLVELHVPFTPPRQREYKIHFPIVPVELLLAARRNSRIWGGAFKTATGPKEVPSACLLIQSQIAGLKSGCSLDWASQPRQYNCSYFQEKVLKVAGSNV